MYAGPSCVEGNGRAGPIRVRSRRHATALPTRDRTPTRAMRRGGVRDGAARVTRLMTGHRKGPVADVTPWM